MVQWIAILVALVCLSGQSLGRSWVGFNDEDIGSWKADPEDDDYEGPGSKYKYFGGPDSSDSDDGDYNDPGSDHSYKNDEHFFNYQGYHNDRDRHAFGHNHGHDHRYHGDHGYDHHWGPHGHKSHSGSSGQYGQYRPQGHPGEFPAHPGYNPGLYGHHSDLSQHGQYGEYHGHPSQTRSSDQANPNGRPRVPQNNVNPFQRTTSDADRVVFPDFINQVPTTRSPQPSRPATTTARTTSPITTTTDRTLLDLVICIRACPTTSEYNPVCGTNGVTYNNPGALQCARNCGLNVGVARQAPCPRTFPQQQPTTARPNTNPTTGDPIGQTTRAPAARPTTERPTTTTVNPTRFTNIDVNSPNRPTTIPLDTLQSVFGIASPTNSNTQEPEFDIDKRMNP